MNLKVMLITTAAVGCLCGCSGATPVVNRDLIECRMIANAGSSTDATIPEPATQTTLDSCLSARGYAPNVPG
jgi:hypothetical protein